jgi:hypothetical protein
MRPKTEKVVDPESIAWIERREGRGSDEGYFASAWRRALIEAESDMKRRQDRPGPHRPRPAPAQAGQSGGGHPK